MPKTGPRKKFTPEEWARVEDMYYRGLTFGVMARIIGINHSALVHRVLRRIALGEMRQRLYERPAVVA